MEVIIFKSISGRLMLWLDNYMKQMDILYVLINLKWSLNIDSSKTLCFLLCAVVTGATSGIGKAYASEVSLQLYNNLSPFLVQKIKLVTVGWHMLHCYTWVVFSWLRKKHQTCLSACLLSAGAKRPGCCFNQQIWWKASNDCQRARWVKWKQ